MTTTNNPNASSEGCPAERLLKALSGKWKPQIFRLAVEGPVRFSSLMRDLDGANKQSVSLALKELEEEGLLIKHIIQEKPLHIEYVLSDRGRDVIPVFVGLEKVL